MDDKIILRPAVAADAEWMSALHSSVFSGLPSGKLGRGYLFGFYREMVSSPLNGCFVAEHEGRPAGFICGSPFKSGGIFNLAGLFFYVLMAVLRGKLSTFELLGLLSRRSWEKSVRTSAELDSMAVAQEFRGSGAGKALVERLKTFFRDSGVVEFCVFTDTLVSTGLGFYLKHGFVNFGEYDNGRYKTVCLRCKLK